MTAEMLVSLLAWDECESDSNKREGGSDQFVRDEFFINVIADNVGNVFV